MKALIVALFLTVFSANSLAAAPQDLQGVYDCTSIEVGTHVVYKGTTTLTKTNQTYAVSAEFDDGSTYSGVAIFDVKKHVLSTAFVNPKDAKETGVAIAHVQAHHVLQTTWAYINQAETGTSTCVKRA